MKGNFKYMRIPNAVATPKDEDNIPTRPRRGLARTQSDIINEQILKTPMMKIVPPKKGITESVFFSSSMSKESEVIFVISNSG